MKSTPEPTERGIPPLGAPVRQQAPAPAPRPADTPGFIRHPDGRLETQIPRPAQPRNHFVANCFMGCIGGPIRPQAPAPADTAKPFETGDWTPKGLVITDTPADPFDSRNPLPLD